MQLSDAAIYILMILAALVPVFAFLLYLARLELNKQRAQEEYLRRTLDDRDLRFCAERAEAQAQRSSGRWRIVELFDIPTDKPVDVRAVICVSLEDGKSPVRLMIFRDAGGHLCLLNAEAVRWPHGRDEQIPIDLCGAHRFSRKGSIVIIFPISGSRDARKRMVHQ